MLVLAVTVPVGAMVLCFLVYMALCVFVIVRTGSSAGLRDLAVAMRAFPLKFTPAVALRKKSG